jgi:hypothetical protein
MLKRWMTTSDERDAVLPYKKIINVKPLFPIRSRKLCAALRLMMLNFNDHTTLTKTCALLVISHLDGIQWLILSGGVIDAGREGKGREGKLREIPKLRTSLIRAWKRTRGRSSQLSLCTADPFTPFAFSIRKIGSESGIPTDSQATFDYVRAIGLQGMMLHNPAVRSIGTRLVGGTRHSVRQRRSADEAERQYQHAMAEERMDAAEDGFSSGTLIYEDFKRAWHG